MTNLPYVPTEYSIKPGLKKLEDEPHFIIDEWYPDYRNEKMDARHENLEKYYIEKPAKTGLQRSERHPTHNALMKTITLWMAETLAKQYRKISFRPQKELCPQGENGGYTALCRSSPRGPELPQGPSISPQRRLREFQKNLRFDFIF